MSSYHLKRKKISVKRKKNRQKTNCLSNSGSTIASANTTASIKLVAATAYRFVQFMPISTRLK
ncbi:hypothetical protein T4C_11897 [Trichinella pseudospiralis]|uniref:Uncharacterized protein n=1 Tax=Trichinella pseudospiralis TaxID=6337 RepID=A0A0V1FQD3_TRIPS|nr:hypothetical protein T4D_7086 [Trichinella pseudospiralis]KRZ28527.1 hypothetical protein T4C_11897 [Trichinella pseudospiralis]